MNPDFPTAVPVFPSNHQLDQQTLCTPQPPQCSMSGNNNPARVSQPRKSEPSKSYYFCMSGISTDMPFLMKTVKDKGKVYPRIDHEGPDQEQRYSSTLSLTLL